MSSSIESLLEEYEQRAKQYEVEVEKKPRKKKSTTSKKSPNTSIILNDGVEEAEIESVSELNISNLENVSESYLVEPAEIPTVELNEDFSERYPEDSFKLLTEEEVKRLLTIEEVCDLLDKNFGLDLVVMDLTEKCSFAEYLVFVTGSSHRHMKTLAKSVIKELTARKLFKLKPTIEGETDTNWMVVDAGNIIVQVFSPEGRKAVDLERKWSFHSKKDFEPTLEELANAIGENPKRKKKK
ncbi:predicted protein [Naegleria gruberi]|uniref:Predicted protein n=1 Tax=Naegleria gruberi TaxID=5762 RepID=D2VAH7_NAEGR|nr:uncharacterized protein NAEGRDRAFT_65862 [Naegleria gruberi]EFC46075.1 predicted protein [Naegleria gruberi]|eukprot:XP_002678819.1 predicted protein [Naegleria gruberi strain NEG-M]